MHRNYYYHITLAIVVILLAYAYTTDMFQKTLFSSIIVPIRDKPEKGTLHSLDWIKNRVDYSEASKYSAWIWRVVLDFEHPDGVFMMTEGTLRYFLAQGYWVKEMKGRQVLVLVKAHGYDMQIQPIAKEYWKTLRLDGVTLGRVTQVNKTTNLPMKWEPLI